MEKFWVEHVYLLYIATIGSYGVMVFLIRMIVKNGVTSMTQMTESIKDLYDKYNDLYEKHNALYHRYSELQGEHNARKHIHAGED